MNATKASEFILTSFELGQPLREAGKTVYNQAKVALINELEKHEIDEKVTMNSFVHIVSGSY